MLIVFCIVISASQASIYLEECAKCKLAFMSLMICMLSKRKLLFILPGMVTNLTDPKNYRDAMSRSDAAQWENALKVEMHGLFARNAFSVVDPPDGQTILGTTVVYKTKRDVADGNVTY